MTYLLQDCFQCRVGGTVPRDHAHGYHMTQGNYMLPIPKHPNGIRPLSLCLGTHSYLRLSIPVKILFKCLKIRPVIEWLLFSAVQWLNLARAKATKHWLWRMKLIHHGDPEFPVLFIASSSIFLHFPFIFLCKPTVKKFSSRELTISASHFMINVEYFTLHAHMSPKVLNCFLIF